MLVRSFDHIVSRIRATGGEPIKAASSAARSCPIRSEARSSRSAIGRQVHDNSGLDDLVRRKDHAADDPRRGDGGAQPAAGIEKAKIRRRRVIGRKSEVVPPGNPVLREHHRGVVTEQRAQPRDEAAQAGCLQRADDEVLRTQHRGVAGRR